MVNTSNDKSVPELYASSEDIEALKHKLDSFIQEQDTHNKTITSSLEKLLKLAEESGAKLPDPTLEDKGSSVKGKDTHPSYRISHLRRPEITRGYPHAQKKVNFASSSSTAVNKQLLLQHSQYQSHPLEGQLEEDEFTDYDDGDEYFEQPWNLSKPDDPYHKQMYSAPPPNPIPNPPQISPNLTHNLNTYTNISTRHHHNPNFQSYSQQQFKPKPQNRIHNYTYNPNPNLQYNYHPPPHNNYNHNFQCQQRAVARGPKLQFPEFTGDDTDGWLRKAEKYFEMIGVPNEDRVKIAVMFVNGKAEYWWRGTGCNANTLP
jgi:hypothetical protein